TRRRSARSSAGSRGSISRRGFAGRSSGTASTPRFDRPNKFLKPRRNRADSAGPCRIIKWTRTTKEERMSPVILGFGALDAMIAAQAAYDARDLSRKRKRKK